MPIAIKLLKRAALVYLFLAFGLQHRADAEEYLSGSNLHIVLHEKRMSQFMFEPQDSKVPTAHWGLLFRSDDEAERSANGDEIISYTELPNCTKPEVQLHEVLQTTPGSEKLDVVYYSPLSSAQLTRKSAYPGFAVPYNPTLLRDSKTNSVDQWQMFARFTQIRCLPTRFHFIFIGSKRYISYRLGSAAWEH